ncbi:MAG: formylglycine-generating enzyme family protein [Deltaproteobacteria bacterium]|nr:formylglycine-generating enzyme family protein [Deltaproteobacteria bacterium]
MRGAYLGGDRGRQLVRWALGVVVQVGLLACSDTVEDGVYACQAPGRDTDCPAGWYCRPDETHPMELRCHQSAGPPPPSAVGDVCGQDSECAVGHCSNGQCAPEGFAWIPPGTFFMGSPVYEPLRYVDEELHRVTITRPFLIGTTEVTQAEWEAVFPGSAPSYFSSCGDDCPVERVNLLEAMEYANARSEAEGLEACYTLDGCQNESEIGSGCPSTTANQGRSCSETDFATGLYQCTAVTFVGLDCEGYRLPTEAEWEYAARAGSTSAYPQVVVPEREACDDALNDVGWHECNSDNRTHPVGRLRPNLWGLYDTVGNVFEPVWDEYVPYGSLTFSHTDPIGIREDTGPMNVVLRGGAFDSHRRDCRNAFRGHGGSQGRSSVTGFRLARTVAAQGGT